MHEFEGRARGLVRLIYASRATSGPVSGELVQAITAKSIQNNRVTDITGLLVVGEDRFLQVLEGPAASVSETFERVSRDPRHSDVVEISQGPAERRLFRDWNMAHRRLGAGDAGALQAVGLESFAPDGLDGDRALRLLQTLGQAHLR